MIRLLQALADFVNLYRPRMRTSLRLTNSETTSAMREMDSSRPVRHGPAQMHSSLCTAQRTLWPSHAGGADTPRVHTTG